MSVSSTDMRNLAIVGHNGTGKTSLLEQMLFHSGVISRAESIDSGKTTSDYTEEEIARKVIHPYHTCEPHLERAKHKMCLTPREPQTSLERPFVLSGLANQRL